MGYSTQEYWSGLPFPTQGDLPHRGIEPLSLESPILAGGFVFLFLCFVLFFTTSGERLKDTDAGKD